MPIAPQVRLSHVQIGNAITTLIIWDDTIDQTVSPGKPNSVLGISQRQLPQRQLLCLCGHGMSSLSDLEVVDISLGSPPDH